MELQREVTRADVARAAGTSTATVSYVVNNGPRNVLPETRERVLAAIRDLGYRPNLIARSLRAASTQTIGMIVPDIDNPFFSGLVDAIEGAAHSSGRLVFFGTSAGNPEREQSYIDSFLDRRVDGIIAIASSKESFSATKDQGTPLVVLDRIDNDSFLSVGIDNVKAARVAVDHLLSHGFERIGCITGPTVHGVSQEREAGWRQALLAAGLEPDDELVARVPYTLDGGRSAAARLLNHATPPTAILAASDVQGVGAIAAAHELGKRVPDDLALVSIDGTALSARLTPPMTVVRQPMDELASAALTLLSRSDGPRHITVPHQLVIRESCGCPVTPVS